MALFTPKLEFSEDDLSISNASATWVDVTSDLQKIEWWAGRTSELDEPQPGGMRCRLRNTNQRWTPDYAAGQFYPNVDTERRFRLTMNGAVRGIWFTESFEIDFPTRKGGYSEAVVSCVDGMGILSTEALPALHPAEATTYGDVVAYYEPSFSYAMNEPEGTKMVSHARRERRRREGESKRHYRRHGIRHWKTRETRAEVEGQSGPSGTYVNSPSLGQPGLILGDPDTCVVFNGTNEYGRIPVDTENAVDTNRLSVEAWIKPARVTGTNTIVSGPYKTASIADTVFGLRLLGDELNFYIYLQDGTASSAATSAFNVTVGQTYHLVGTWGGWHARVYANGVEVASDPASGSPARSGEADEFIRIGVGKVGGSLIEYFQGSIMWVNIYEKLLEPESILHLYEAGAQRGYPSQLTGARISAVASDTLWSSASIGTGTFQMQPRMQYGQPRLDAIVEAAVSEMPRSHFYFNDSGNPVYEGWDDTPAAAVNSAVFGPGGVPFLEAPLVHDNEIYNTVKGSTDGGPTLEVSNAASVSSRKIKVRDEELGLPLESDTDVQTIIETILFDRSSAIFRPASVTIAATEATSTTHALSREIGEWVRVRVEQGTGHVTYRQCLILGYKRAFNATSRVLQTTYDLSRGFDALGLFPADSLFPSELLFPRGAVA